MNANRTVTAAARTLAAIFLLAAASAFAAETGDDRRLRQLAGQSESYAGEVRALLAKGADSNVPDLDGRTALHAAASIGAWQPAKGLAPTGELTAGQAETLLASSSPPPSNHSDRTGLLSRISLVKCITPSPDQKRRLRGLAPVWMAKLRGKGEPFGAFPPLGMLYLKGSIAPARGTGTELRPTVTAPATRASGAPASGTGTGLRPGVTAPATRASGATTGCMGTELRPTVTAPATRASGATTSRTGTGFIPTVTAPATRASGVMDASEERDGRGAFVNTSAAACGFE